MPSQLRQLFASILLFCDPREFNAYKLLYDHWKSLDEDYYHQQKRLRQDQQLSDNDIDIIVAKTLIAIEKYLLPYEKSLSDYSIPSPDYSLVENAKKNDLITQESNYNSDELEELLAKESLLNVDQNNIYNTIINALDNETEQKLFFVDGPGGYGKTFLFNMILAKVSSEYGIAIAVASSGIAALLLNGERTAHSRFKIPIKLTKDSTLDISYQSELAELIRQTKLFIWDEAPMAHKFAFEAVDKTFRDLTNVDEPFGGKIFILGGDFRQILPVVIRGGRTQIVDACIKSSRSLEESCYRYAINNQYEDSRC